MSECLCCSISYNESQDERDAVEFQKRTGEKNRKVVHITSEAMQ